MLSWLRRLLGRDSSPTAPEQADAPSSLDDLRDQIRRDVAIRSGLATNGARCMSSAASLSSSGRA
jgi:hypothetical protein